MLATALVLVFFVFPIVITLVTAMVVARVGIVPGAIGVGIFYMLTPLGMLFAGMPLIFGLGFGALWATFMRR